MKTKEYKLSKDELDCTSCLYGQDTIPHLNCATCAVDFSGGPTPQRQNFLTKTTYYLAKIQPNYT